MSEHVLEPAAQAFADATAKPPLLYELGVDGARKLLDDVQAAPIDKPDVDEKEGGREPGELLVAGPQGRGVRLRPPFDVREVGVPEPRHCLRGQEVAFCELLVRACVHRRVGDRVPHRVLHEADIAAVVRHQCERCGHAPAHRLARDSHALGVQAVRLALPHDPLGGGVACSIATG